MPSHLVNASPAMRALLALSRAKPDSSVFNDLGAAGTMELLQLASHHGQLGAVLLAGEAAGRLGSDQARTLLFLRRQAALWDLERDAVMRRLGEAGAAAELLKGAALRLTAYRDPVERPFGDIDVLVSSDQLLPAVDALEPLGYTGQPEDLKQLYRQHHHHLILSKAPGFKVEMHWGLLPVRYPLRLDPAAFLQGAVEVRSPTGLGVRVPRPEHMLLHVAVQSVEDSFARLRRLVDIDRIITTSPGFDWDWLAREIRRLRLESVTALSLRLTELLLGTAIPPGYIADLRAPLLSRLHLPLLDPLGQLLNGAKAPRAAVQRLLLVWSIASGRDRLRFLRELLTGSADWFWRAVEEGPDVAPKRIHHAIAFGKLGLFQLSRYPAAFGRRRPRAFWGSKHGMEVDTSAP
ncbi:MAG TPA: nucleotidyltransferase family protein [Gemmatimonadales bacterium]|jgi:hypothetical protein|nr:nucleotidyltransferase family protein [Gemmatimonadales bacterium]